MEGPPVGLVVAGGLVLGAAAPLGVGSITGVALLATRAGGEVALVVTAAPALLASLVPPKPENRLKPLTPR